MENRFVMQLVLFGILAGFVLTAYSWNKTAVVNQEFAETADQEVQEADAVPKKIALTFDDGPGKYTEALLDGLKERNVKATFFVLGTNAESHRDLLKRMVEEGHVVGNHTYNHVELTEMAVDDACTELRKTNELIYQVTGQSTIYVRPPYGEWNDQLSKNCNMIRVLWSIDPLDWSIHNRDKIVKHIVENADDGSIILLHDIFENSVEAALAVVDELKKEGYEFVTIDQLGENPKIHVN